MTLRARRLFLPLLLVGLIAAGCSSSDGETALEAGVTVEDHTHAPQAQPRPDRPARDTGGSRTTANVDPGA